jgi:acetamidase/formamidase
LNDVREPSAPLDLSRNRRSFLTAFASTGVGLSLGTAASARLSPVQAAALEPGRVPGKANHWYIPARADTVHWGYFSKHLRPQIEVASGDFVTVECATHQASDDYDRMIKGDPGLESIYHWTKPEKSVARRGAGPMDAPAGAGAGWGVHVMTGPIAVRGAAPGDILEVRIVDMYPRPSANPLYRDKAFGTNLAANWGYHYHDLIEEPKPREVITIYEIDTTGRRNWATPVFNYRWVPTADPHGVVHRIYDYPGVVVDHRNVKPNHGVLSGVRVPIRPHFGNIGLAAKEAEMINSIPPSYTAGNMDDWRIGKGAVMYYPVSVDGALISMGDTHAAQGDSELAGTAIESSWTGVFQVVLHKQAQLDGTLLQHVNYPLLETRDEWVVHGFSYPNYLATFGSSPQQQNKVGDNASVDKAMRDAFRKMRDLLMNGQHLSEDEAISLISVAVDFGVTQVVDGNWGVHATLKKAVFAGRET